MASLSEKYHEKFKGLVESPQGRYAFRGQEDAGWPLESSARSRMKRYGVKKLLSYLEKQFIEPAKLNGWHRDREVNRELKDLEILARFQHYGAATCLLDFTRSFHVALWFACRKEESKNGKVFIVNTGDVTNFSPIGMEQIEETKLSELLETENVWYWDLESLTERVARQNSVFILGGDNLSEGEQYKSFEIEHEDKEGLIKEMEDLSDLRQESLFKDMFGFASINTRNDPLPPDDPVDNDPVDFFKLGNQSYQKGDYDEAIKHYTKAIELDPKHVSAYYNRGSAYEQKGDHDLAIEDFNKAIDLNPDFASAYFNRGNAYAKKEEHDLAIADYSEVIELDPNHVVAYYNRGNAYQRKREYDHAIENYTKAIELNPNYAEAYYNRGVAYWMKGEYDRAIADYSKAIEINPDHATAYYNRGLAYQREGEPDKAQADFDEAKRLNRSPPSQ